MKIYFIIFLITIHTTQSAENQHPIHRPSAFHPLAVNTNTSTEPLRSEDRPVTPKSQKISDLQLAFAALKTIGLGQAQTIINQQEEIDKLKKDKDETYYTMAGLIIPIIKKIQPTCSKCTLPFQQDVSGHKSIAHVSLAVPCSHIICTQCTDKWDDQCTYPFTCAYCKEPSTKRMDFILRTEVVRVKKQQQFS